MQIQMTQNECGSTCTCNVQDGEIAVHVGIPHVHFSVVILKMTCRRQTYLIETASCYTFTF